MENEFGENTVMQLAREGKLTIYEALSLQKQDEIIDQLREIKIRIGVLETITKYSRH